jgi:hypothetical protein
LGVGFLDVAGIGQQDGNQVPGYMAGVDSLMKAIFHQVGQVTAVVDVGMR